MLRKHRRRRHLAVAGSPEIPRLTQSHPVAHTDPIHLGADLENRADSLVTEVERVRLLLLEATAENKEAPRAETGQVHLDERVTWTDGRQLDIANVELLAYYVPGACSFHANANRLAPP